MANTSVIGRSAQASLSSRDLDALSALEKKVLWLATWTIHHANYIRENSEGLKVGGHQASSASLATIMTALYFRILRPQDRVRGQAACVAEFSRHSISARQTDA
jgi:pyruvate dehydrogenase complex dehydrogenase (E1) component